MLGVHVQCRSVLAEAVFTEALMASPLQALIRADAASIGPSFKGGHDSRVMWVAQKAGLSLPHRNTRPFDEQADIVNYDLVLTMDHFDHEEVWASCVVSSETSAVINANLYHHH